MKKTVFKITLLLSSAFFLSAQNSQNQKTQSEPIEEEIELPDVTTVVNGKTFTAGKDSVPDYSEILPENDSPEIQLPQMDGVKSANNSVDISERASQKEKDIYAQGELGAGYPFYFKGDFSIYRASGDSPFEIDFNHESTEGFAREKSNEGFFERATSVHGKQSFYHENVQHTLEAEYKMNNDGLQLKSDSYSDTVKHTISANANSDWSLSNGILISYGLDAAWFNRYGQIMKESETAKNFIDSTKIIDFNPYFGFGWQNDTFTTMLTALYGFQGNLDGSDNLLELSGSSSNEHSHRGQFKLALGWENDSIKVGADGSVIVGSATGKKDVLPAFTALFDFKTDYFTEGRFLTVSAQGGLQSYQEKIRTLENTFKFSAMPAIPTETSDWFAKIDVTVPILTIFEATSGFEFKKTAFENGVWQAIYNNTNLLSIGNASPSVSSGLYCISPQERTEFNTDLGFSVDFSPLKAGIEWKSFWKDVPSLEDTQKITLSLEYQSLDAKWNAGTTTAFAFGKDTDTCPDISAWAGVRLASRLSLALELNDTVKLFRGAKRKYAHSQYITTSGNAMLLVKFQF